MCKSEKSKFSEGNPEPPNLPHIQDNSDYKTLPYHVMKLVNSEH